MLKKVLPLLGTVMLCATFAIAQENNWTSARPDGHAPINIMGDHIHKKGEVMVSYRFMTMNMNGNLATDRDISNEAIFNRYMVAPQNMQMNMHMIGLMYAPSNRVTLMVMGNYQSNSMDLETKMGMKFNTESKGVGDISVSGLIGIMNNNRSSLHTVLGISIPTGDIQQRDDTPMMEDAKLAYPMQLGSGTWDPTVGLTYLKQWDKISWGAQTKYKMRIAENPENYSFGNQVDASLWGAYKISNAVSLSTSLYGFSTSMINEFDPELNALMMPLASFTNTGRSQFDVGVGSNFYVSKGALHNLRLAGEVKFPVSQSVIGIQMKNNIMATFGIQYAIGH